MTKKSCLDAATGGLYVTLTSQVVVYGPAERADLRGWIGYRGLEG
jgi:hypothetical protein